MLTAALAMGALVSLAAPAGYGSADGKVRAKVPVARPIKRSGPKKDTIGRKEAADTRRVVVVSDLEIAEGGSLPTGVDFAEQVRSLIEPSKKLRLVFAAKCYELECMRKVAAKEQTAHLVFASLSADGRITVLLNELPGRGLLRKRHTPPLEAADLFAKELSTALSSLLGLGTDTEGLFEPDAEATPEPVAGEDAAALARRQTKINNGTYTVYAGAGLMGLGLGVGMLATVNASQWRGTSFRHNDGAYREQIRQIAAGRAFAADMLLVSGLIAGSAGYYMQRKGVAGPMGEMTLGWGQDTWKEPEATETPEPGEADTAAEGDSAEEGETATEGETPEAAEEEGS